LSIAHLVCFIVFGFDILLLSSEYMLMINGT
jgi:hypothetical protein